MDLEQTILSLLRRRGPDKTACPSEVARKVDPVAWRASMQAVRDAAGRLAERGAIEITQRGTPATARTPGAIRLRIHQPTDYRVGRGEEGVFHVEPYKSELLPLFRFRTEALARTSAKALTKKFLAYRKARDFAGMDMARKYLQMGFTRSRRYANHASGRKRDQRGHERPREENAEKAACAAIFKEAWDRVERDPVYAKARALARVGAKKTVRSRK